MSIRDGLISVYKMKLRTGAIFAFGLICSAIAQFGNIGFSDKDTDDMDYASLLAMPR